MSSTGDKLNVNLKLTKEPNTITDNGYTGQYTGSNGAGAGGGATYITADTLPVADYGKYVTNYVPSNGVNDEGIQWRIFHADTEDDNIYLIADTYVPLTNEAGNKNYVPTGYTRTNETDGFSLDKPGYNGTADIGSNIASKWLKQYTDAGYTAISTGRNAKGTAYLLDTNAWRGFKDSTYAEYAVGGPTIELFRDSYNVTHETDIETIVVDGNGYPTYKIRWKTEDNSNTYTSSISGLNTSESLYVANGMWLASPCYFNIDFDMMRVTKSGKVSNYQYNNTAGARPIICLKDTVKLEKQADGNYKLVQ